ncbi:hypothetical protein [Halobacteriovorax sp. HLS]|uniref:hypothetical protein n=1 Tax=Halobacteriovorax sp. HLS TaxID=2234000 RepID=UPI000FDCBD63|nr:hypothetical protein [Halobacteriovorax sp. HLS]
MFKSSLTNVLYQDFLTSFNLRRDEIESYPFVYVDPETGEVRLLTSMSFDDEGDLFASTMASHGEMEVLSTGE